MIWITAAAVGLSAVLYGLYQLQLWRQQRRVLAVLSDPADDWGNEQLIDAYRQWVEDSGVVDVSDVDQDAPTLTDWRRHG